MHPWEPIITDPNHQQRFFFQLPPCIRIHSPPRWSKSTALNTIEVCARFCMRTSCLEQQLRDCKGWWEPWGMRCYAPFTAHFSPASTSILPHGRKQLNIAREISHWVLQRSRLASLRKIFYKRFSLFFFLPLAYSFPTLSVFPSPLSEEMAEKLLVSCQSIWKACVFPTVMDDDATTSGQAIFRNDVMGLSLPVTYILP